MRAEALSSPVSAYSCLLTSDCLRYAVAKPSFWPCKRACKRRRFSDFHSDSPLNFTSFWFGFDSVCEAFRICGFVVLQSTVCGVWACKLQPWMVELLFICLSSRLPCPVLRRKSGVNRLTVGCPLQPRVCHSAMAVGVVVRINVTACKQANEASTSCVWT